MLGKLSAADGLARGGPSPTLITDGMGFDSKHLLARDRQMAGIEIT